MTERDGQVPAGEGAGAEAPHLTADELVDLAMVLGRDPATRLHHLESCADCTASLDSVAALRGLAIRDTTETTGRAAELAESVITELSLGVRRPLGTPGRASRVLRSWLVVLGAAAAAAVAAAATAGLLAGAGDVATGPIPLVLVGALGACYPVLEELVSRSA